MMWQMQGNDIHHFSIESCPIRHIMLQLIWIEHDNLGMHQIRKMLQYCILQPINLFDLPLLKWSEKFNKHTSHKYAQGGTCIIGLACLAHNIAVVATVATELTMPFDWVNCSPHNIHLLQSTSTDWSWWILFDIQSHTLGVYMLYRVANDGRLIRF